MGTSPGVFTQRAEQLQDQRWASQKADKQQELAPLTQASQAAQTRLALYADPTDPTHAVPGREREYAEAHDQLADIIGKMRTVLHPPPANDPHGLSYLGARALDKLHITNDLKNRLKQGQTQKVADYNKGTADQVQTRVQSIPYNPLTPDEQRNEALIKAGLAPKQGAENFKTQQITLSNGHSISAQQDTKSGKWLDLNGKPIPEELLAGAKATLKAVAPKGLTYDKATGEVLDKDSAKRYAKGDPNNPPEVAAMFRGADELTARNQAFQVKLAGMRGAAYNMSKPLVSLDSANGNAPTMVTFGQMQQNPGRYVPAGEADKAIAKENLMQDISGTSKLTRQAINALPPGEDFTPESKVKIAAAMRADDPHASLDQLIASGTLGSLTEHQQDFMIATRQLAENAMAMRSILGAGQGSQDVREAVRETLPGLLSPDRSYALRQLNAFDATINRLHRGVPNVKLNETPMSGSTSGDVIYAKDPQGKLHKGKKGTHLPPGWVITNGPS